MYQFVHECVRDAMTASPLTVTPETTLADAQALFEAHGFNGLPVVVDGRLEGVVTKLDVLRAFTLQPDSIVPAYSRIMAEPVARVMTRQPVAVAPDTPLTRVLQRMVDMGVKSLPVLDGDRLAGVVAREDVLAALRRATG